MELLLRYLVFVGLPYLIARRIEKYFWTHADPKLRKKLNKKLKNYDKKIKIDKLSDQTQDVVNRRGGFADPILLWILKILMTDFAIKTAIAGAVGASIWSETADNAAAQLAKYGKFILAAPGQKFTRLLKKIKNVDPTYSADIREILFDKELTNEHKLELLKIKIENVLKNLNGSKRKQFVFFVIAMLAFSVGGNFPLFAWFMERLRALIDTGDDVDSIKEYIIDVYREYNAPLPRDLVEDLPEEIIKSITDI